MIYNLIKKAILARVKHNIFFGIRLTKTVIKQTCLLKETAKVTAILLPFRVRSSLSCIWLGLLISQIDADEPNTLTR